MPTAEIGGERCLTALICVAMYHIQNLMSKILTRSTLITYKQLLEENFDDKILTNSSIYFPIRSLDRTVYMAIYGHYYYVHRHMICFTCVPTVSTNNWFDNQNWQTYCYNSRYFDFQVYLYYRWYHHNKDSISVFIERHKIHHNNDKSIAK